MRAKHFLNDPNALVVSALESFQLTDPSLSVDTDNKILYSSSGHGRVRIISGGGSGHEPSFAGFVGEGLLSAAAVGNIFASPSSQQVLAAIEHIDGSEGILVLVMNYTGDVLNFGVAVETAKARYPDMKIEMLVIGDDVSVVRSRAGRVGRRGIAGNVLVHKVTGAMAAANYGLETILRVGQLTADNLGSVGASLERVHVPGHSKALSAESRLGLDEVELGMGIHNEAGCGKRGGSGAELPALVSEMLDQILDAKDADRNYLPAQDNDLVLLVNNLGALSILELRAAVSEVVRQLERRHRKNVVRIYAGTFMTSLDGAGFSISLLNIVDTGIKHSLVDLLDASCNAAGWHATSRQSVSNVELAERKTNIPISPACKRAVNCRLTCDLESALQRLRAGLSNVISSEPEITKYDSIVGDGDCGTTLERGAKGIMSQLTASPPADIISLLSSITFVVEKTMDGTSGALYAIFLNSLTHYFVSRAGEATVVDSKFWSEALDAALNSLKKYTAAEVGDRTLMDALIPFVVTLRLGSLQEASAAAAEGAMNTMFMRPGLGRTVYIGDEDSWLGTIPDPGAWGLHRLLQGFAQ